MIFASLPIKQRGISITQLDNDGKLGASYGQGETSDSGQ